jgi:putative ABC transport system permease protein
MMRILRRLRFLRRTEAFDREFKEELEFHRAELQASLEREGQPDPSFESRRRMGNLTLAREESREVWLWRGLADFRQDVRYALRTGRRDPLFSCLALITLALGIGATTAIFSIVYAIAIARLPYRNPTALVEIHGRDLGSSLSLEQFGAVVSQSRTLSGVAAGRLEMSRLAGDEPNPQVPDVACTENIFDLLGVHAQVGRTFGPADVGRRVAVLSHDWWVQRFGGDPGIVGRSISLNATPYEVVGVMPASFRFPYNRSPALWIPADEGAKAHTEHSGVWLTVARLAAGNSIAAARSELALISDRLPTDPRYPDRRLSVLPLLDAVVGRPVRNRLFVLLGAVALVLLIACVNVASLLLTRSRARTRELALRAAIGADRRRLVRQLITEAILIGLLGGVAGLLLARWTLATLIALIPSGVPRVESIAIDQSVLLCACALSLLSGLLIGILPAWRLCIRALHDELQTGFSLTAPTGTARAGAVFVFAETALAVVLLVGAGLMIRSFALLIQVDPGFNARNIVAITLAERQSSATLEQLRERAKQLPGVREVSGADLVPFQGLTHSSDVQVQGRPVPPFDETNLANVERVMPGYFRMLGLPIVRGREFTDGDRTGAPAVAVINEAAVRRFFPHENPLGTHIYSGFGWPEIVGIAKDARWRSLADEAPPAMYFPILQAPTNFKNGASLLLRMDPSRRISVTDLKAEATAAFSPLAHVFDVQTEDSLVARSAQQWRFQAVLLGTFGALALLLAVVGIFGVTSYSVVQRTREIGVRLALGASRTDMLRLIVAGTARPVIAGLFFGLFGAIIGTRALAAFLFQLKPTDPTTYAAASGVFLVVALSAATLPAYRATRVDPAMTLRHE